MDVVFNTEKIWEKNKKLCVLNIVFNTEKIWRFRGNTRSLKPLHRGYAPTPQAQCSYPRRRLSEAPLGASRKLKKKNRKLCV